MFIFLIIYFYSSVIYTPYIPSHLHPPPPHSLQSPHCCPRPGVLLCSIPPPANPATPTPYIFNCNLLLRLFTSEDTLLHLPEFPYPLLPPHSLRGKPKAPGSVVATDSSVAQGKENSGGQRLLHSVSELSV